jgi:hypothetical protein
MELHKMLDIHSFSYSLHDTTTKQELTGLAPTGYKGSSYPVVKRPDRKVHLHLVPRLRMNRILLLRFLVVFMAWLLHVGTTLPIC